jgi:S1-C subfamily serine protease
MLPGMSHVKPLHFKVLIGLAFLVGWAIACKRSAGAPSPAAASLAAPALAASAAAPPPAVPLPPSGARTQDENNTIQVFQSAGPSAVFVTQKRVVVDYWAGKALEVPAGSGSGFVWDKAGHIVTNYHVVRNARSLSVTLQDHSTHPATVRGAEPRKDIAVLKIDAPQVKLVPIAKPSGKLRVAVGQKAIAIGNPFGLDQTLTVGVVSAQGRSVDGIGGVTIRDMIQTDAAINPGNSGGPLLDSAGRLMGMNTAIYSKSGASAGVGFAVPASTIMRVVPQIIRTGQAEQVGLGIRIDPEQRIERRVGVRGVVVIAVAPTSPAAQVGLRGLQETPRGIALGDIIVQVGSEQIADYDDLYNALDRHRPGDEVAVKVLRDQQPVTLKIRLIKVQ